MWKKGKAEGQGWSGRPGPVLIWSTDLSVSLSEMEQ